MRSRFLAFIGALTIAIAFLKAGVVPVAGQSAAAKTPVPAKAWTPLRTAWGDPDLQGIWNNSTITPIERPKELAGKQVLTNDEVATLEEQAAQSRVDRPPPPGNPGTYNQFWFDRGTKVVPTRRTSLV